MTLAATLPWLLPIFAAAGLGLWQAARPALTPSEFGKDIFTALLFAGALIFMFHMVWIGAAMMSGTGIDGLGYQAWGWTWLTATIWIPALVISYIIRAMRIRNAE